MRPGSRPRQPLSLPEPSRSVRQTIAGTLPIVLVLILLPPLAFASPPDPSWVAGFFDGADGDDTVSLVYETSAASAPAPSHLGPLPCLLEISPEAIVRYVPDRHFTRGPRSPPVLRSPEFVSVFHSLPPPASLTEALVTRPSEISPTSRDSYNVAADVAARTVGINRDSFVVARPEDFPTVSRSMREKGDQALLLFNTPFMETNRRQILDLAATHQIPVMYEFKAWVEAGGLMFYGPNMPAVVRRSAVYVDKIPKGAQPADLRVEQPLKFELVVNLKTAKALGLTTPQSLLARADEVI